MKGTCARTLILDYGKVIALASIYSQLCPRTQAYQSTKHVLIKHGLCCLALFKIDGIEYSSRAVNPHELREGIVWDLSS